MYQHILVPLDGSPLAESVLPYIRSMVSPGTSTRITLLRAIPEINPVNLNFVDTAGVAVTSMAEVESECVDYLSAIAQQLQAEGYNVQPLVVEHVQPETAIVEYVRTHNVDLITLATHGRSGLGKLVFGSVTEKVLHHAGVPVLVIPPHMAA
ncbi:MAG: universal stress protein [Chloroflexaceae bacterium]|nr:universal stress protein [Chloroflexaceae bacterium]